MEDDFNEKTWENVEEIASNGEMPVRVEPEKVTIEDPVKTNDTKQSVQLNGDTYSDHSETDGSDNGSDCNNLIIDENPRKSSSKKRKRVQLNLKNSDSSGFKGFKKLKGHEELEPLTNPYFNESIVELSQIHHKFNSVDNLRKLSNSSSEGTNNSLNSNKDSEIIQGDQNNVCKKEQLKKTKKVSSPKLREYAQYLGLQPTVQFKCPKCSTSGFSSLSLLNEHRLTCNEILPKVPPSNTLNNSNTKSVPSSTNFRVTRKVYLCSACGTYYENWNLFLHMREVHKRFICLYCLGMFSHPEKLSLHLISKHNCVPNKFSTIEDFFRIYKEPCFLICCDCENKFSEEEDFINHDCQPVIINPVVETKSKNCTKNNSSNQKISSGKSSRISKSKNFVGHVTADSHIDDISNNSEEENKNKEDNVLEENTSDKIPLEEPLNDNSEMKKSDDSNFCESREELSSPCPIFEQETCENFKNSFDEFHSQENNSVHSHSHSRSVSPEEANGNEENEFDKNSVSLDSNRSIEKLNSEENDVENVEITKENENNKYSEMISDEHLKENREESSKSFSEDSQQEDTRKVPKVTLKLPKIVSSYTNSELEESDDSEKLTLELENDVTTQEEPEKNETVNNEIQIPVAGTDVPVIELELEQPLDKFDIKELLQKCLSTTAPNCVYCNHARKIAVNGKQLGLHAIGEHRFSAVVNSITAEELIPESFVSRIKESLQEVENSYFNLISNVSEEGGVTFSHEFECFQCRFSTTVHKELYLHNRKMHAKSVLLCIMCKSNFYSYSELICHLCPGVYILDFDLSFRCCMCVNDDLPSAFRLMVHLRKRHHACDVCLDLCNNQSKLSNHVWKHKLHHLCYRCGIAYRNKPDITKHLFWKHGTESVLCKRCLQKKWPHVYHFCIPPSTFTCEECNLNFTKAVALKVHKRIHGNEKLHGCTYENCTESFVSKKLLIKHELKHREPPEETAPRILEVEPEEKEPIAVDEEKPKEEEEKPIEVCAEDADEKPKTKPKVDVYDIPELNLSESDSSDSESEDKKPEDESNSAESKPEEKENDENKKEDVLSEETLLPTKEQEEIQTVQPEEMETNEVQEEQVKILENIWEDFKNYQKNKEKLENLVTNTTNGTADPQVTDKLVEAAENATKSDKTLEEERIIRLLEIISQEHDYCLPEKKIEEKSEQNESQEVSQNMDHDYCSPRQQVETSPAKEVKPSSPEGARPKLKLESSSGTSSGSDSTSCSCGSNCSCTSSSDSSSTTESSDSDSSTSEGRRKQQAKRQRAKEKSKSKNKHEKASSSTKVETIENDNSAPPQKIELPIEESDLDTTETETDEDFYDKQPQKIAKELLAKKKERLLAGINGSVLESSRPSTPSLPEAENVKTKKKSKNKKKKKKNKKRSQQESSPPRRRHNPIIPSTSCYPSSHPPPTLPPLTLTITRNSPLTLPHISAIVSPATVPAVPVTPTTETANTSGTDDSGTRASKRRRVPNKFYGYTSEDEEEKKKQPPVLKWRKADLPTPPPKNVPKSSMVVPPITIKAPPQPQPRPATPSLSYDNSTKTPPHYPRPKPSRVPPFIRNFPPPPTTVPSTLMQDKESASESNESSSEDELPVIEEPEPEPQPQPQPHFSHRSLSLKQQTTQPLYCYCRCPYDEVSEMIGCDSNDCAIEWFHFECVGIMVPPKGQWFCPDCRKKKQQQQLKKELLS